MAEKPILILYSTLGCHLCEQAKSLISPFISTDQDSLQEVDISADDLLIEKYGVIIPVLLHLDSGNYIQWPFNVGEVERFLISNHVIKC